jgi:hypothetical protein
MPLFKTVFLSISQVGLFWQEKVNGQIFRWNVIFILCQVAILFVKFNSLPPQIPLFFSLPWGGQELAPASSIFLLPALALIIMLLNNLMAVFFLKSSQLFSRLLIIFSLVCSVFTAVAVFQIVSLVS